MLNYLSRIDYGPATISQILRSQRSAVGAVSLIVTTVPAAGVRVERCTQ